MKIFKIYKMRPRLPVATAILMMMVLQNVNAKPQDPNVFENVASQAFGVAGNMAEMAGNAGMISKKMGFELPFAKANSETEIGTGAALRNDDDDSSEEIRRRRRRRSSDLQLKYGDILGEESLLAFPHSHRHKRASCHGGGGGTGGGTGGGDDIDYGEDIDLNERRRRARKRKAAARKRARKNSRKINDDVEQDLTRRKRQSEIDDLNQNMTNANKDFSQQAQQFANQIHNIFANFINQISNVAMTIKQKFNGQNSTSNEEI